MPGKIYAPSAAICNVGQTPEDFETLVGLRASLLPLDPLQPSRKLYDRRGY